MLGLKQGSRTILMVRDGLCGDRGFIRLFWFHAAKRNQARPWKDLARNKQYVIGFSHFRSAGRWPTGLRPASLAFCVDDIDAAAAHLEARVRCEAIRVVHAKTFRVL